MNRAERNLLNLINDLSHYGTWHFVGEKKPDVEKYGDGNFCHVAVKTSRGLMGKTIFGTSGFAGEPYSFGSIIKTECGDVKTDDPILMWKYMKHEVGK